MGPLIEALCRFLLRRGLRLGRGKIYFGDLRLRLAGGFEVFARLDAGPLAEPRPEELSGVGVQRFDGLVVAVPSN